MLDLPAKFKAENKKGTKTRAILVKIQDEIIEAEKTLQSHWTANTAESNVDYLLNIGNVTLLGTLLVCEGGSVNKIYNIEPDGNLINSFATSIYDPSATAPHGISYAVDGTIWVCDDLTNKIYNIEIDGTLISSFTASSAVKGVSYAANDTLWVCDRGSDTIYNLETDGTLISSFTTSVYDVLSTNPTGISYAANGTLWVCDGNSDKIYNIETDGTLISSFTTSVYDVLSTNPDGISYAANATLWICDSNSDKIYNIETDGTLINSFATSVFDPLAVTPTGICSALLYYSTGYITTDNIDIGQVPTVSGEWQIQDVKPDGTTLTYEAWSSATGAFTGEEISLGAIVDGDPITDLKRYYRVKASFTANTGRDKTPVLQSIKADFSTYIDVIAYAEPGKMSGLTKVSTLSTTIADFAPSTIGSMTITFPFNARVSKWFATRYPKNRIVKVKFGFIAAGFTDSDYIDRFYGQISAWNIGTDNKVKITIESFHREWKKPVPEFWENAGNDKIWTAMHPVDIMLDIIQNYLSVRDSKIDFVAFYAVRDALPGWVVTRTITEDPVEAKELMEELRGLMSCHFLLKGDGKVSIKRFDAAETPVAYLSDKDFTKSGLSWDANAKSLINTCFIYYNYNGTTEDEAKYFDNLDATGLDTTSRTNWQENAYKDIKDKWTKADQSSQVETRSAAIIARYKNPPSILMGELSGRWIALEAGDIVAITTRRYPSADFTGCTNKPYQIVKVTPDWMNGKVTLGMLEA